MPKPTAFVLIPFDTEFDTIYSELIVPALDCYDVIRADTRLDERSVLEKIVSGIASADLIIADLTTLNANVMYELGIAHTLGKPTIMLSQNVDELPFDVRAYPVHIYSTHFKHALILSTRLKELGTHHMEGAVEFGNPVSDFLRAPLTLRCDSTQSAGGEPQRELFVDDEYGQFDFETDLEQSKRVGEQIERFLTITAELTTKLGQTGPALRAARRSNAAGSGSESKRLADEAAVDLRFYSEVLDSEISPVFHSSFERLAKALLWVASQNDDPNKRLIENVIELEKNLVEAVGAIQGMRDAVPSVRGQTRDLTRAAGVIEQAIENFLNELTLARSYVTRIKAVLPGASG